jgi:hypothetical protein
MNKLNEKIRSKLLEFEDNVTELDTAIDNFKFPDLANSIEQIVLEESKINALDYCKFRDTYKRHESQKMHLFHLKLGGLTTWSGTSDESIYEAYLKGEQHYDPLIKEMEDLKLQGGSADR